MDLRACWASVDGLEINRLKVSRSEVERSDKIKVPVDQGLEY